MKKKREIIETFPIPNTKAELVGFMIAAKSHIQDTSDPLGYAYYKKYQQCVEQARISFPNDKLLVPFIEELPVLRKTAASFSRRCSSWWGTLDGVYKYLYICIFGAILFVLICVIGGLSWWVAETAPDRYEEKVIQTAYSGDLNKAMELYTKGSQKYHNEYNWGEDAINAIYEEYLKTDLKVAENMYNTYKLKYDADDKLQATFLSLGQIDDYWRFSRNLYNEADDYKNRYDAMVEVVKFYCENGETSKAKTFVEKNINWFYANVDRDPKINEPSGFLQSGHDNRKPYRKAKVQEQLMAIINQY